jgi:hypothetical protein
MPSHNPVAGSETFTLKWQDPRMVQGEPIEAAKAAIQQLHDLTTLMKQAIPPAVAMIRNASMSEGLAWNESNDPADWWDSSEQKAHLDVATSRLNALNEWADRIVRVGGH